MAIATPATATEQAVEVIGGSAAGPDLLLSCEHASRHLPAPWQWQAQDHWLRHTHWAYDIGAATLTRQLAQQTGAAAALSRFSRLLIDANRPTDSDTLIRRQAQGRPVLLNAAVSAQDRARRLAYWRGYHRALGEQAQALARRHQDGVLLALHSFTPLYEGHVRELALGVLFDAEQGLGEKLLLWLRDRMAPLWQPMPGGAQGAVKLNEPYSGREGLIYSAQHHAEVTGLRAIEMEVRQDLIVEPGFRAALVAALAAPEWRQ
ncbi:MAG TPA: hypothetical protein ENK23_05200 [Sorangium sp.]|nr:hypothetical protein [Sorangium sp.]